jgi:hypothetical protein
MSNEHDLLVKELPDVAREYGVYVPGMSHEELCDAVEEAGRCDVVSVHHAVVGGMDYPVRLPKEYRQQATAGEKAVWDGDVCRCGVHEARAGGDVLDAGVVFEVTLRDCEHEDGRPTVPDLHWKLSVAWVERFWEAAARGEAFCRGRGMRDTAQRKNNRAMTRLFGALLRYAQYAQRQKHECELSPEVVAAARAVWEMNRLDAAVGE